MHDHRTYIIGRTAEISRTRFVHREREISIGLGLVHRGIGCSVDNDVWPVPSHGIMDCPWVRDINISMRQTNQSKALRRRSLHEFAPDLTAGAKHQNCSHPIGHRSDPVTPASPVSAA